MADPDADAEADAGALAALAGAEADDATSRHADAETDAVGITLDAEAAGSFDDALEALADAPASIALPTERQGRGLGSHAYIALRPATAAATKRRLLAKIARASGSSCSSGDSPSSGMPRGYHAGHAIGSPLALL